MHGNTAAVKELEAIAPYPGDQPITRERIILASKWSQFYGGLTAYRETSNYFYSSSAPLTGVHRADVCAVDQGNVFSLGRLLPEFLNIDFKQTRSFPIPIVMFMGRHDYTTPSEPTVRLAGKLTAPYKQGIWFERSSHMVPWEEPGKMLTSRPQRAPACRACR